MNEMVFPARPLGVEAQDDGIAALQAEIDSASEAVDAIVSVDDRIKFQRASTEDKVRSKVTLWVVISFLVLTAVAAATGAFATVDQFKRMTELISITFPVLTLVLGHYFGSSGR